MNRTTRKTYGNGDCICGAANTYWRYANVIEHTELRTLGNVTRSGEARPETPLGFQRQALEARRDDWQRRHDAALAVGSRGLAAAAARFVRGYDDLIAMNEVSAQGQDVAA